ncbi:copper resistance protein CopC [Microbacterium horticulturae]|uniref:Copper resistance protein CopC n=1 Tax=Microbacterium horticulturae TaxID=3028316 RepID=A0ABY8BXP3_9MICO|nr:copper resistance protein CopC [Microbacterium sp. KACC 23027]WEG08652.1 copper resistance protein CopC [Microbacterium sp. KACC 23027]
MIAATTRRRVSRAGSHRARLVAVVVALFVLWQLLAGAMPASAHAVLVTSDPLDGARLTTAPTQVTFTFDETVQLPADGTTAVADDGTDVARGSGRLAADGRTVLVPIAPGLPDGAYTVGYRVVSADGHIVGGAVRFGVNADPDAAPAPVEASGADPLQVVSGAAQGAVYLGIILAIGTTAAALAIWPETVRRRRARAARWLGWALLVGGTLVRLLLAGPVATGSGWAGVVRMDGIRTTLAEPTSLAELVRLIVLLTTISIVVRPERQGRLTRLITAGTALAVLATVAVDGHAASGSDAWLAVPVTVLHLAAMAFWAGGLLILVTLLVGRLEATPRELARLHRWSIAAFASVGTLLATGEYMAWRQLVPLASISDTAYGRTLLVKLALVTIALGAAVASHRRLLRHALRPSRRRVRASVAIEASLTIAVIAVTTLLVALPPARTSYGPATTITAPAGDDIAQITIGSTHTGVQHLTIALRDPDGKPVPARSVTGTISADTLTGITLKLKHDDDTTWTGDVIAPVSGVWTIQLSVDLGGAGTYATAASYRVWG